MATIIQELQRILKLQKEEGIDRAWISPENLKAFYALAPTPQAQKAVSFQATSQAAPQRPQPAAPQRPQPAAPQATPPRRQNPAYQPRYRQAAQPPASAPNVPITPMPQVANLDWDHLTRIAMECHACPLCAGRQHVVFGEGCTSARLMFIGEGPGADEDQQGRPFVGRAGQMLTRMILAMGLNRDCPTPDHGAYIANIVKCRPPQNRNPQPEEGIACLPLLKRQIQLVKPECIVLLGAVPLKFLLGKTGITRLRGQWLDYEGIPVMPTFHPAYLLRFERYKAQFVEEKHKVWSDLQQVMARLGLQRPK